jgi:hypothetical protein
MSVFEQQRDFGRRQRKQGSALLSAIIFSFVVMLIMGSYLYLSSTEYRISTRSYLFGASFNLAEGGLDLALDALSDDDNTGWTTGTSNGSTYWSRAYTGYDLGRNISGEIRVVILDAETSTPEIYSEGLAKGHLAGNLSKQIRVDLSSGFFPFLNGFNSKSGIILKGNNVTFDSYDSSVGDYGTGNQHSDITVSTISVVSDAVDIGNANVYGYVATGGGAPDVGPQGSITTYANPGEVDESRVTTDYYAEFPSVSPPELTFPLTFFPTSGTISGGDYLISDWSSSGNNALYITGDVRLVATGEMSMSGQAAIYLASSATLEIYVAGDMDLSGSGIMNTSQMPEQLLIFGTNTTEGGQSLTITGNGALGAAVYAPNAIMELKGGGDSGRFYGAVAAYEAKLSGNSHFSYDESLADYNLGGSGYAVEEWVELSGVSMTTLKIDMAAYGL